MYAIIKGIAAIFIHVSGALCKQICQVRWNINQREVVTESKTYYIILYHLKRNRKAHMFSTLRGTLQPSLNAIHLNSKLQHFAISIRGMQNVEKQNICFSDVMTYNY